MISHWCLNPGCGVFAKGVPYESASAGINGTNATVDPYARARSGSIRRGHRMHQASTTPSTDDYQEIAMTAEDKTLPLDPFANHDVDPPVSELKPSDFFPPGVGWNHDKPSSNTPEPGTARR